MDTVEHIKEKKPRKRRQKPTLITIPEIIPTPRDVLVTTEVFHLGEDVYIKELACYFPQTNAASTWSFKQPYSIDCLQEEYLKLINLQTLHAHQLAWKSGELHYTGMYAILHRLTSTNAVYYYVQEDIPNPLQGHAHVDLVKMGCPHPNFLQYEGDVLCPNHQGLPGGCALQKALKLGQWYKTLCDYAPAVAVPETNIQK